MKSWKEKFNDGLDQKYWKKDIISNNVSDMESFNLW